MCATDDHVAFAVIDGHITGFSLEDGKCGVGKRCVQRAFWRRLIRGPVVVPLARLPDTITAVDDAVIFQLAIFTAGTIPEAQRQPGMVDQVDLIFHRRLHVQAVCRFRRVSNIHHIVGQCAGVVDDAIDTNVKATAR